MEHEQALLAAGHRVVAGVDEAGRGPLAGPVSVAAVVLPVGFEHPVLNDSKKLTEARREVLYEELTGRSDVCWHCVMIPAQRVDEINILQATYEGMRQAALALKLPGLAVLIDGKPVRDYPLPNVALVKGDSLSYSIAAASVIAKVTRDRYLLAMESRYPGYGFAQHKGYGTAAHLAALRELGPCPEHRRSFAPVSQLDLGL